MFIRCAGKLAVRLLMVEGTKGRLAAFAFGSSQYQGKAYVSLMLANCKMLRVITSVTFCYCRSQFDTRTAEEIHAERDAQRTAEDLAARQMRDEQLPFYGDQPIKYDRYDPYLDWEPPFAAAAEAGQPIPSIEQLRQEVAERLAARERELLEAELIPEDRMPDVTSDEVMYGRLLEGEFYQEGVKETLRRRAEQAKETAGGGGAATMAAAALTANVEAAEAAGEAAAFAEDAADSSSGAVSGALLDSSSSGGLIAAADRWPWPTVQEVLDEAAERRAAQRVWVLMGGDGPGRQQSLRSGANIVAKLQRCCDLQVGVRRVRGYGHTLTTCHCSQAGSLPFPYTLSGSLTSHTF